MTVDKKISTKKTYKDYMDLIDVVCKVEFKRMSNSYMVDFDELQVFDGVKDLPARVRCASISSQALLNTLKKEDETNAWWDENKKRRTRKNS